MDKAKAAVSDFMQKSGHHDTTVHESVAPAVKKEVIKPHQHEEVITAVDKETHQDHYHRTVQPVKDREVLPEVHEARLGAVQHREFDHRDHEGTKKNLAAEQQQFRDEQVVTDTSHSQSAAPVVGGEHVHHHIHETIQPVVHKETIQPSVVHTTVPIHEVHHNEAKHHQSSELPAMTMDDFKKQGGVLGGREERYDGFEGEPKNIGGTMKNMMEGKTSKRDSAHASGLKEASMHGDYDPLDGGHNNNQNAAGFVAGEKLGDKERSRTGMGVAGGLGGAGVGTAAAGRREERSDSSSSDKNREYNEDKNEGGVGQKIKSMLSSH